MCDKTPDKPTTNEIPSLPLPIEELRDLIAKAQAGDQSVLPRLQQLLDEVPALWQHYGDLSAHCLATWANLVAGPKLYLRESVLRKAVAMKEEIAGADPGPLEKLLAERVMLTWLVLVYYESLAAEVQVSLSLVDLVQKRLDRAQRRHLAAIKSLATLRKLLPKAIDGQSPTPNVIPAITTRADGPPNGASCVNAVDRFGDVLDDLGPLGWPQRRSAHQQEPGIPAMHGLVHRFANLVQHVQSRNGQESELAACSK